MTVQGADRDGGIGTTVEIRGLVRAFGRVRAVDGVDLAVGAGEFVALLGPSGSGKTTLLMAIAGFETPDAGSIAIGGRDVTGVPANKRGIGMVFQRYALFPHMTVAENIAFPLKMRGQSRADTAKAVETALDMVRLAGYGARRTSQLSGGQQQRVALARALVYSPRLMLMDEPLGALDKNLREEMQFEIKRLQRRLGTTVIYVTHDQSEALTMADRVAVMDGGHIQQYAPPKEIYDRPANAFVAGFVGETNFIPGTLAREGKGWVFVAAGGGGIVPVSPPAGLAEGASVRLAARPELLSVADGGTPGGLEGEITELVFSGATVACLLRLPGEATVMARLPAGTAEGLAVGNRHAVAIPETAARVFPA